MIDVRNFCKIYLGKLTRKLSGRTSYDYSPIYNYYYLSYKKPSKTALLVYRVLHVREQSRQTWSSGGDVHDLLKVLSELGYQTDIVDPFDATFIPRKSYDLFIGNEQVDFERYMRLLPQTTVKIFYPAIAYWRFNDLEEQKRIDDLFKRRGIKIHGERVVGALSQDYALEHADGVILLSNEEGKKTYPHPEKILHLDGASFVDRKIIDPAGKDYRAAKNNFLFLSGSGNVHHGLDLVLEAFARMPDKHLFVCSKLDADFTAVYKKELFNTENIHYIGHIRLYNKFFKSILVRCNYLIFPSCGEGSPGSVADCMVQGLIPLVSQSAHTDVDNLGYYIDPCTTEEIIKLAGQVSSRPESWYRERCQLIQNESVKKFAPKLFREKMKNYLRLIIDKKI